MNELASRMKAGNPRSALDYCSQSNSPVARVMAQGIMHMGRTREELTQRVNTAIDMEQVEMERNLSVLGTMSNIAPLLGLFGTVVGIINAFQGMALTGSGGIGAVSAGISEALIATAFGLFVAIPAVWAYNYFTTKVEGFTVEMDNSASELIDYMAKKT